MPMLSDPSKRYCPFKPAPLPNRTWPDKSHHRAPIWLSTDLRDGNQSLANPMTNQQKLRFFRHLVQIGFKEIEVAYPAASETDFQFVRDLIRKDEVPDDVWIQVLTPARADLIKKTFEAVAGLKNVIIHMYNATSCLFREASHHQKSTANHSRLATDHTNLIRELAEQYAVSHGTNFRYEYSPETFSQTDTPYAIEVCEAVKKTWLAGINSVWADGRREERIIFNLPATVEISTPNCFADQVEMFCSRISERDKCIISLHTHNDRGCAVAAAELGVLAGADRIEGTILGNGERTGNVDLVTLALNYYSQGITPNLDFSDMYSVVDTVTECTGLPVHPRHPYAGELVFTAFSGSHQDAVKKGFEAQNTREKTGDKLWNMPYLPIDPADVGCTYEAVIRVNSQSGKGGIAYIVKSALSLDLPRRMQIAFYKVIQERSEVTGKEMTSKDITTAFRQTYHLGGSIYDGRLVLKSFAAVDLHSSKPNSATGTPDLSPGRSRSQTRMAPLNLLSDSIAESSPDRNLDGDLPSSSKRLTAKVIVDGKVYEISGKGNGPLSSFLNALQSDLGIVLSIREYTEHAVGAGSDVKAATYVELIPSTVDAKDKSQGGFWGVGVDVDITASGLKAVVSAANGFLSQQPIVVGEGLDKI
nr:2-isopropylmalate synthase [Cryptococcus depauperatus CBS 7841]